MGSRRACYQTERLATALELLLAKLPDPTKVAPRPEKPLPDRARKLLRSELERVRELYQKGVGVQQIAEQLGVDRETIRRNLRDAGVPPRSRGLTDEQIDEAVLLYQAGQSLVRIGERLGVDACTVKRRLLQRGVTMRPPGTANRV